MDLLEFCPALSLQAHPKRARSTSRRPCLQALVAVEDSWRGCAIRDTTWCDILIVPGGAATAVEIESGVSRSPHLPASHRMSARLGRASPQHRAHAAVVNVNTRANKYKRIQSRACVGQSNLEILLICSKL
jgi:hypothetical protein